MYEGYELSGLETRFEQLKKRHKFLHEQLKTTHQRRIKQLMSRTKNDMFVVKSKLPSTKVIFARAQKNIERQALIKSGALPKKLIGNKVVGELPIDYLYSHYANHRRLKVFAQKGLKCAQEGCLKEAARLIVTMDRQGGMHPDLYTQELQLMTVDHIKPKSLGGGEEMENKQPMCSKHNFKKGSTYDTTNSHTS